jgi:hypothetical protein
LSKFIRRIGAQKIFFLFLLFLKIELASPYLFFLCGGKALALS